jgi:hypothetical protein
MLDQTVLFISAEPALAHRYHDNPKNRLSGTAPLIFVCAIAGPATASMAPPASKDSAK